MTTNDYEVVYEEIETPQTKERKKWLDQQFRAKLKKENINLKPSETVMDYIQRKGYPYSIVYDGERNDN